MSQENDNCQRTLVFQGGGALGAYEAGTYQHIYRKVSQENPDGRLFDIIAGTSIGAINSSVLVGHYLKNNSWVWVGRETFGILERTYVPYNRRWSVCQKLIGQ